MNNKRKGILLLLLRDRSLYCANENCVIVNRKEFAMKKGKISKASVLFLGGTTYYYKVRAAATYQDGFVYSKFSPVVSAKCTLEAPSGLALTVAKGKISASWSKVAGATGYRVFRATSKTGTYTRIKSIANASTLSYADTSVTAGKTYYYKVRAYRTVNGKDVLSEFSNIVGKTAK